MPTRAVCFVLFPVAVPSANNGVADIVRVRPFIQVVWVYANRVITGMANNRSFFSPTKLDQQRILMGLYNFSRPKASIHHSWPS